MSTHSPLVRRTFRMTIDVEASIDPESNDLTSQLPEESGYQQALVRSLLAHPDVVRQLLRSIAVDALTPGRKLLEAEYGWGRGSDQQLLQPIIEELKPAARAYLTEELEDGARAYYIECYGAAVKGFDMIELEAESMDATLSSVRLGSGTGATSSLGGQLRRRTSTSSSAGR
jgi:hypothetical protein